MFELGHYFQDAYVSRFFFLYTTVDLFGKLTTCPEHFYMKKQLQINTPQNQEQEDDVEKGSRRLLLHIFNRQY